MKIDRDLIKDWWDAASMSRSFWSSCSTRTQKKWFRGALYFDLDGASRAKQCHNTLPQRLLPYLTYSPMNKGLNVREPNEDKAIANQQFALTIHSHPYPEWPWDHHLHFRNDHGIIIFPNVYHNSIPTTTINAQFSYYPSFFCSFRLSK